MEDLWLTLAPADDKVFARTAKCRPDNELLLLVSFECSYCVACIDLHEFDLVGAHAD
jgi:hypothetical protein